MDNEKLIFPENWIGMGVPDSHQAELSETGSYGKFILEPLHKGYGITIGNALRRVLLSSIMGSAIYALQIEGVSHEYDNIKGIKEDILEIILNIKEIYFSPKVEGDIVVELNQEGPKIVTARDISTLGKLDIINPDKIICNLSGKVKLEVVLYLRMNRGFIAAEENNRNGDLPTNTIYLDSYHSPIKKVHYEIQNTRVGQKTDFDKLIFEIWTNGVVKADDAIGYASKILKEYFTAFIAFDEVEIASMVKQQTESQELQTEENPNLNRTIKELELSVRSLNCLRAANVLTIRELVQKTEMDMLKTKNFGKKSLNEIRAMLSNMKLSLGMQFPEEDK